MEESDPVASISASCTRIAQLEFPKPGVFTNAIITKPEVTSLIRDALAPELSLYRITKSAGLAGLSARYGNSANDEETFLELRPERIDGKSIYVDHSFSEDRTPAARVPDLVPQAALESDPAQPELLSPTKKRLASRYSLIPKSIIESENVDEIYQAVSSVIDQYPSIGNSSTVRETLTALQREYTELVQETEKLEHKVADQRVQLDVYNDSLNELLPRRGIVTAERETDIDEIIAREEKEIEELEARLTRSQQTR